MVAHRRAEAGAEVDDDAVRVLAVEAIENSRELISGGIRADSDLPIRSANEIGRVSERVRTHAEHADGERWPRHDGENRMRKELVLVDNLRSCGDILRAQEIENTLGEKSVDVAIVHFFVHAAPGESRIPRSQRVTDGC